MASWKRVGIAVAVAIVALALAPSATAQSKSLRWLRWDAAIDVNTDGSFVVTEEYEVEFIGGPFTFGFRDIPMKQFEDLTEFRVYEGSTEYAGARSEAPNTFYVEKNAEEYVVNWFYPATTDQARTFVVEYRVVGGLFISEELGDRLFWNAVGPDHDFPIESSSVVVQLPADATVDYSTDEPSAFGPANSTIAVSEDSRSVSYAAKNIPAGREFEVGVYWPHGFVNAEAPGWQEAYEREQAWNEGGRPILNLGLGAIGVLLLVMGPGAVYLLWLFSGRDPEGGVAPEYLTEPPSELAPGLVGTLIDEKADLQDIMATVVDLARRGYIEMEEKERKVFGVTTSKEFTFRKVAGGQQGLRGYEDLLVRSMFGRKDEIEISDLRERFYTYIPKLQKELYKDCVSEGLFPSSPQGVRGRYLGLGIAALVITVGCGFFVAAGFADRVEAVLCPFVSLAIGALALIGVSGAMPTKTRKGSEEAAKWNAFKEFLKRTERYADLESMSDRFEKYLPYAIAFGLERGWIDKFSRVPSTPIPGWYIPFGVPRGAYYGGRGITRGGGAMEAGGSGRGIGDLRDQAVRPGPGLDGMSEGLFGGLSSMSSGLFSMLNSTSRAFTSVPRSSGGSGGFSGGGFSGGFSGGGGGGGGGAGFG